MEHKDRLYDKPELVNRDENSALVMNERRILEYKRQVCGSHTDECLIFSYHAENRSRELVLEYWNDILTKVRLDGEELSTELKGDRYIVAWKFLELGRKAWVGKPLT